MPPAEGPPLVCLAEQPTQLATVNSRSSVKIVERMLASRASMDDELTGEYLSSRTLVVHNAAETFTEPAIVADSQQMRPQDWQERYVAQ